VSGTSLVAPICSDYDNRSRQYPGFAINHLPSSRELHWQPPHDPLDQGKRSAELSLGELAAAGAAVFGFRGADQRF